MMEAAEPSVEARQQHEQMLKLVAKGFYNELISYGVEQAEVLTVAGHLLDNLMQKEATASREADYYNHLFRLGDIIDEWVREKRLTIQQVSLRPLTIGLLPTLTSWLRDPDIISHFHPPFPQAPTEYAAYFGSPMRQYFGISYDDNLVGLIGAENIDRSSRKLEMRKLVGHTELRGQGIGKRATFLFLYYVFVIMKFNKVYLHSLDTNIRNLNLNSKFGFELEGVLFDEAMVGGRLHDVLRMGLRASAWMELFR